VGLGFLFLGFCGRLLALKHSEPHVRSGSENFINHQQAGTGEVCLVCESHLQHSSHKGEYSRHVLVRSHSFEHDTKELVHFLCFTVAHFKNHLIESAVESVRKSRLLPVNLHFLQLVRNFAELKQELEDLKLDPEHLVVRKLEKDVSLVRQNLLKLFGVTGLYYNDVNASQYKLNYFVVFFV
jgi:hypothetical protein